RTGRWWRNPARPAAARGTSRGRCAASLTSLFGPPEPRGRPGPSARRSANDGHGTPIGIPFLDPAARSRLVCSVLSDAEVLARCPLLAGLPDDDILALAAAAQRRAFAAGEHVFLAGDASRGLLVSAAGRVRIYVLSPATGREVVLTVDGQFGAVAELVALEGASYP